MDLDLRLTADFLGLKSDWPTITADGYLKAEDE